MKKYVSFIMILFLLFNVCSISVMGLDDTQVVENVTEDDSQELLYYDDVIYADIKNEIRAITATSPDPFSCSTKGTLYLTYNGPNYPQPIIILGRIVYLDRAVVLDLNAIYNSQKADDVVEFILGQVDGVITSAIAAGIAKIIGAASSVATLIGIAIPTAVFLIKNLDRWNFNSALQESTTGKLKVYSGLQNVEGSYVNYVSYDTWDDGMVTVPDGYNYSWEEGYCDLEGIVDYCDHQFGNWTLENSSLHVKKCTKCSWEEFDNHSLIVASGPVGELYHTMVCVDCNYTVTHSHTMRWVSMGADTHRGTCTLCNYTKTESHAESYDYIKGRCKKCGYTGSISSIMSILLSQRE